MTGRTSSPSRDGRSRLRRTAVVGAVLALVAAGLAAVTGAPAAVAAAPASGTITTIGGKCVDVRDAATANGTPVQLYDCNGQTAQAWTVGTDRSIRALGKCMELPGGQTASGTLVRLWDCNGAPNQQWVPNGDGTVRNVAAGLCLDVANAVTTNRSQLRIWNCNRADARVFVMPGRAGGFQAITGKARVCLDIQDAGTDKNGLKVGIYGCNGRAWQSWDLTPDGLIHSTGRCLELPGGQTGQGTAVQMWDCNGLANQKWQPRADGSLFNALSNQCLDLPNGDTTNLTLLRVYPCNGSDAQRWSVPQVSGSATVTVDAGNPGATVPSTLYGYIIEDISRSVEGGLYGELVRNRTLKESDTAIPGWSAATAGGGSGSVALDRGTALNTAIDRSLKVDVVSAGPAARVGAANGGYFGMKVTPSTRYTVSFFAKASAGLTGPLTATLQSADGAATTYASATVTGLGTGWKKFTTTLTTNASAPTTGAARFVVWAGGCGTACPAVSGQTLWLSTVSLFPPTFKGRTNGLRTDLADLLAKGKPGLFRLPGGNYLQGSGPTSDARFPWKQSLGPIETRPGHQNTAWGYWSTDGMGLLEYLQMAEDTGSQPLLALYAGFPLGGPPVSQADLGQYVQEGLDEIEYAIGSTSTTWGARRAADGHPAPFDVKYVEIGNEDFFDKTGSYQAYRFPAFYDAIKAKYPQLKLVATTGVDTRKPDVVDDHYYEAPGFFAGQAHRYDAPAPGAPAILVGEYGSIEGSPTGDLAAGVGEAAFLTGLERNSATIVGSMYAPILVNENNRNWPTNMIGFDATRAYGAPSYWVERTFAENVGTRVVPAASTAPGLEVATSATSGNGSVYVKLVNSSQGARTATVTVNGGPSVSSAKLTTITGAYRARNTLDAQTTVAPTTSSVAVSGGKLTVSLPANSANVVVLGAGTTPPPTPTETTITNPGSGRCLTGTGTGANDRVTIADCTGSAAQQWSTTGGVLRNTEYQQCIGIENAVTANGTRVLLDPCVGSLGQLWKPTGDHLVNGRSGRCLDIAKSATAAGSPVQIWDCGSGKPNQSWTLD